MVVWKSSPNGKSEPISRRNNSLLRNLNGSELTFVSCQVQHSGGWEGLRQREQYIRLQMVSVPARNAPKVVGPRDIFCVEGCVLLLGTCTLYQRNLLWSSIQWLWFKSTPLHYDLGRRGGAGKSERCCQSWPERWPCHGPTFSPFVFVSLSFSPCVFSQFMFWVFTEMSIF